MAARYDIPLRVTERGYEPTTDDGWAQHKKLKPGMLVGARIARSRSIQHHRRYWKVLECAVAATDWWETPELLHIALKEATGHFTIVRLMNGRMVKVPGSTSFDDMNQEEFGNYCDAAFRILAEKLDMSIETLLDEAQAA